MNQGGWNVLLWNESFQIKGTWSAAASISIQVWKYVVSIANAWSHYLQIYRKKKNMFADGWFQYKSLKYRNKHLYIRVPWQYAILFLWSLHPSTNKIDKKLKNTQTIFPKILLNSTFSGNLTSLISDYLP